MHILFPPNPTVKDCIETGATVFMHNNLCFGHGTDNAYDEAAVLLLHALGLRFDQLDDVYEQCLQSEALTSVAALFEQRIQTRKPAAYLIGEAWFAGSLFEVNEHVLVPRSPFAELIEDGFAPWVDADQVHRILDLCTGSGCIAIACAKAFPEAIVDAVDLSDAALAVANRNIRKHQLSERVHAIHSDLFGSLDDEKYDLIVSNPPYVSHAEMASLPAEYQAEPDMGFDGGPDGLVLVHRLLSVAADFLTEAGALYVEVGSSAETLQGSYPRVPFLWQEFEQGGDGVFMLTRDQLLAHADEFKAQANG